MVEIASGQVVTNDFAQLTLDFSTEWRAYHRPGAPDLYPEDRRDEIDEVDRAGLRRRQQRRLPLRVRRLPGGLRARLSPGCSPASTGSTDRLSQQRYLVGDTITEADVRLFTTLARFDAVYHGHFKCNRQKLSEMPVLWALRPRPVPDARASATPSTSCTSSATTTSCTPIINPTRIVPAGPALGGWLTTHHREELGGRPFGDGTPPGPPTPEERVPGDHGAVPDVGAAVHRPVEYSRTP